VPAQSTVIKHELVVQASIMCRRLSRRPGTPSSYVRMSF